MKNKKLFLLDMDGTIYLDDRLFDGVTGFLMSVISEQLIKECGQIYRKA